MVDWTKQVCGMVTDRANFEISGHPRNFSLKIPSQKPEPEIVLKCSWGGMGMDIPRGIKFKAFMELLIEEIMKHKWIESQKAGTDLGFDAEMEWIKTHAPIFRKYVESIYGPILYPIEFRQYMLLQVEQIMKHKYLESEKAGRDLGQAAELEWIRLYAADFREYVERVNGPILQPRDDMGLDTVLHWIDVYTKKLRHCFNNSDDPVARTA